MGLWDSIKQLTKPNDFTDDELDEPVRSPLARTEKRSYEQYAEAPAVQENSVRRTFLNSVRSSEKSAAETPVRTQGSVNLGAASEQPMKLLVIKPVQFADAAGVADSIRERNSVLLNVEGMSKEEANRLIDFVSGAAYIQGGRIRRVAGSTFIITPPNVNISGDVLDTLGTY